MSSLYDDNDLGTDDEEEFLVKKSRGGNNGSGGSSGSGDFFSDGHNAAESNAKDGSGSTGSSRSRLSGITSWLAAMLPPEHPETAARARLPGFEIDSPDKLMMPTTVKARPNAWVSQGFGAFWTLPLKIRMLAVLLFVAHLVAGGILTVAADKLSSATGPLTMPIGLAVPLVPSSQPGTAAAADAGAGAGAGAGLGLGADGGAGAGGLLLSSADSGSGVNGDNGDAFGGWPGLRRMMLQHGSPLHLAVALSLVLLIWVLVTPLVAVFFQSAAVPHAFRTGSPSTGSSADAGADADAGAFDDPEAGADAAAAGSSGSGGAVAAGGDPYVRAYSFALRLLWRRALFAGFCAFVPSLLLRVVYITWLSQLAQSSIVMFVVLTLCFAALHIILELHIMWALPLFVDHPTYSPWHLLALSYTLTSRARAGTAQFLAYIIGLAIAGTLVFGIGVAVAGALIVAAIATAYKDLLGAETWAQPAALAWRRGGAGTGRSALSKVHDGSDGDGDGDGDRGDSDAAAAAAAARANARAHAIAAEADYATYAASGSGSLGSSGSSSSSSGGGGFSRSNPLSFDDPDIDSTGPSFDSLRSALE